MQRYWAEEVMTRSLHRIKVTLGGKPSADKGGEWIVSRPGFRYLKKTFRLHLLTVALIEKQFQRVYPAYICQAPCLI